MTEPPQPTGLEQLRADYEQTKARLAEIGFTCEGSLIERYASCKNPSCRCTDPAKRHGPDWQISWKTAGRTISKMLPAQDAALYQQWITNRRALEQILNEMRDLSHQAARQILAARGQPLHAPERPRRQAA